jgi:hypothetical protein
VTHALRAEKRVRNHITLKKTDTLRKVTFILSSMIEMAEFSEEANESAPSIKYRKDFLPPFLKGLCHMYLHL